MLSSINSGSPSPTVAVKPHAELLSRLCTSQARHEFLNLKREAIQRGPFRKALTSVRQVIGSCPPELAPDATALTFAWASSRGATIGPAYFISEFGSPWREGVAMALRVFLAREWVPEFVAVLNTAAALERDASGRIPAGSALQSGPGEYGDPLLCLASSLAADQNCRRMADVLELESFTLGELRALASVCVAHGNASGLLKVRNLAQGRRVAPSSAWTIIGRSLRVMTPFLAERLAADLTVHEMCALMDGIGRNRPAVLAALREELANPTKFSCGPGEKLDFTSIEEEALAA